MLNRMKSSLGILWNALLTASVVTLLAALFVAAMPPVYRATAIVQGTADDMLRMHSADFLAQVLKESKADTGDLVGWLEQLTSARQQGVQLLYQKLFVSPGDEDGWINVTVEAQNAETAQRFANDIARLHSQLRTRVQLSPEEKAVLFVEVEKADETLKAFMQQHPEVLRHTQERQNLLQGVERGNQQVAQLESRQDNLRQQLEAVRRKALGVLTEAGVVRAIERIDNHSAKMATLTTRYGEQHQKMRAALAEKERWDQALKDELVAYGARLEERILKIRADLAMQQAVIADLQQKVTLLDQSHLHYEQLKVDRKTALARFEGMNDEATTDIFARAVVPGNTLGFNQTLLLVFVFLVSFMLMAILMIVRSNRGRQEP